MKKLSLVIIVILVLIGVTYKVAKNGNFLGAGKTNEPATKNVADLDKANLSKDGTQSSTSAPAGSGTTAGKSGGTQAPGTPEEVKKPDHNCFVYEYHHKKEAQSRDIEDFLDFTNAFPIAHQNWNKNSLCVKVNQKPVAFKLLKNKSVEEVLIGSVVGPDSVIRVSYCVGKAQCKEGCALPKKRFMDDLVDENGGDDSFQDAWGNSNEENKKELKNKVKELRSVASENGSLNNRSIIRDWDTLNKNEFTCKER